MFFSSKGYSCSKYKTLILESEKQFPDMSTSYIPGDTTWGQYLTKSLHGTRKLVLTFDDGPHPVHTPRLLDILKKYKVKATFFAMGELIKKYPLISKRIVAEGHILAGHDWQHTSSNTELESVFTKGLTQSVLAVKGLNKEREFYYRFPYGAYGKGEGDYHHLNTMKKVSQKLFGENCINFAFWDIDTSDWVSNMTSSDIVQTLMANLNGGIAYRFKKINGKFKKSAYRIRKPLAGGVILMHDIYKNAVDATEIFLKKIQGTSILIVPLSEVSEFDFKNALCELL